MNCKIGVFHLLFFIFFPAQVFCGEIVVTDVKKYEIGGRQLYEATINNCVLIKEIQAVEQAGGTSIKYPQYTSKKAVSYPQVIFFSKQAKDAVKKAVLNGITGKDLKQNTSFEITRFSKFKKESGLTALCGVSFNGEFEVECKIVEGKNGLWVSWPARKEVDSGKWIEQIIITDEKLRLKIEQELLAKYEIIAKKQ
jgi:DNA-binding cell septation regulator SpoVG